MPEKRQPATRAGGRPGTDADRPLIVFVAYHRLHLFTYRTLLAPLAERGYSTLCAVFGEHVDNGQVEPDLLASIEPATEVRVLPKGFGERAVSRLLPRRLPVNQRDRRWARRAGRLLDGVGGPLSAVVIPLDFAGRFIHRRVAGRARFVAVQYEPFIQFHKVRRIADLDADLLCTWGELDSEALRKAGVRAPLRATGSPVVQIASDFCFAELAARSGYRLLYTTTPLLRKRRLEFALPLPFDRDDFVAMKRSAMRDLAHLLARLPGSEVRVKLHPFDEGAIEREMVAETGDGMALVEHRPAVPIQTYIDECDLLVTMSSTTAFQAVAAGKPVVLLNYGNWAGKHEMNYLAHGFALTAIDGPSLEWAVRKTVGDADTQAMLSRNRTRYLERVVSSSGTEAVERICAGILGEADGAAEPQPAVARDGER